MSNHLTHKNVLMALSILAGTCAIVAGFCDKPQAVWVAGVLVVVFLVFANIERIVTIKAGPQGIEAEIREVVKDAQVATKEVRELSLVHARVLMRALLAGYRQGRQNMVRIEDDRLAMVQALKDMGIPDNRINEDVMALWADKAAGWCIGAMRNIASVGRDPRADAVSERLCSGDKSEIVATLRAVYEEHDVTDREEYLLDVEYLLANKAPRRHDWYTVVDLEPFILKPAEH